MLPRTSRRLRARLLSLITVALQALAYGQSWVADLDRATLGQLYTAQNSFAMVEHLTAGYNLDPLQPLVPLVPQAVLVAAGQNSGCNESTENVQLQQG